MISPSLPSACGRRRGASGGSLYPSRNGSFLPSAEDVAFRYGGSLRSIHHIEDYEIVTNLHSRFEEIPSSEGDPLFIYTLGEGFAPNKALPTGTIYPSGRVWS